MQRSPRIAAVIQARMRSTRLPGKVLRPIAGKPVLWHVLHRLRQSGYIGTLCVATTTDPADDVLAAYAQEQGAVVVRGPEDNVLERFALAARAIDPEIIVRVTADSPFVDATFIDYLIGEMLRHDADFVVLKPGLTAIHEGADPMSRHALDTLLSRAANDPVAQEHVCSWFKQNPGAVKVAEIDLPEKWRFSGARLSVDTPADVSFIETVYSRLHAQAGMATLTDLIALLRREPGLLDLNAHVQQKSMTASSGTVIMRCDGGPVTGFGHVRRSLSIARALRDREGLGVRFAMAPDAGANAMVADAGFPVDTQPEGLDETEWLLSLAARHAPLAIVLDIRTPMSAASVLRLRGADLIVAAIDDGSQRRLAVDAVFYPPVPQVFAMDWDIAEREPLVGWEWVALGLDPVPPMAPPRAVPRIVVTMGGSDPLGLTLPAVRALASLDAPAEIVVVAGPAASPSLEDDIARLAPGITVRRNPPSIADVMNGAALAVTAFGVTAYEFGALGVPAIYLCLNEDQVLSASAFERSGMGISLGLGRDVDEARLTRCVAALLADGAARTAMSAAGRMNLDGRGAARIAARLHRLVDERREAMDFVNSIRRDVAIA